MPVHKDLIPSVFDIRVVRTRDGKWRALLEGSAAPFQNYVVPRQVRIEDDGAHDTPTQAVNHIMIKVMGP